MAQFNLSLQIYIGGKNGIWAVEWDRWAFNEEGEGEGVGEVINCSW